ncbi:MAG: HAD-IIB family hydrolase [Acidobacteriota bacterium]
MTTNSSPPWVVFTDLDGTLLNARDYRWDAAGPALERLRGIGAALVLNSSKTYREMAELRRDLGAAHPFVVENGAAIFTPKGYFDGARPADISVDTELEVERLGPERDDILDTLRRLRSERGWRFEGFADMDVSDVMRRTGLGRDAAAAAQDRTGTEPLLWLDERHPPEVLARALADAGLRLVAGGRFWHAMGPADKGTATRRLLDRFGAFGRPLRSAALGDSANDFEMLRAVDRAIWIPRAEAEPYEPRPIDGAILAPEPGAAGWRLAVDALLDSALP